MKNSANSPEVGLKFDDGKPDWSLLPMECIEEVVNILGFGKEKYGRDNWKLLNSKEDLNRIYSAMMRHIVAHSKGDKVDKESGQLHLSHAACNIIFLIYNELINRNEQH